MPHFGLLVYPSLRGRFNVGDYVQSLAADQFLPRVDHLIERERLDSAPAPDGTRLILNGWYMHDPDRWPPAPGIDPLITSFHINRSAAESLASADSIRYLKAHGPVGCRDLETLELLRRHDIEAYFSACLTLTLKRKNFDRGVGVRNGVLLVDPVPGLIDARHMIADPVELARALKNSGLDRPAQLRAVLRAVVAPDLLRRAKFLTHDLRARFRSHERRFDLARRRLALYANAELVITSRIHCALPCLAFGTPVIFLNSSTNDDVSTCRFGGLLELLNVIDVDPGPSEVSARFDTTLPVERANIPSNPSAHRELASRLERICRTFVETGRRDGLHE